MADSGDVVVRYWRYNPPGAEALSLRDVQGLQATIRGAACSVYRMRPNNEPSTFLVALVGLPDVVDGFGARFKFGQAAGEPEMGFSAQLIAKFWAENREAREGRR